MLTSNESSSEESEDPDITKASARDREYWLEKRAAKVSRKSVAWFRRIHRHKNPSIKDVVNDNLEPVFESEFSYYKWNVGIILCYLCNQRLTKKTITRDHVIPKTRDGSNRQDNVMPCCETCNHSKSDLSLLEYLARREELGYHN